MEAITLNELGAPPAVRNDLPTPTPGPREVLDGMFDHEFPVTLGRDYAGVVEQLGAGVTRYASATTYTASSCTRTPPCATELDRAHTSIRRRLDRPLARRRGRRDGRRRAVGDHYRDDRGRRPRSVRRRHPARRRRHRRRRQPCRAAGRPGGSHHHRSGAARGRGVPARPRRDRGPAARGRPRGRGPRALPRRRGRAPRPRLLHAGRLRRRFEGRRASRLAHRCRWRRTRLHRRHGAADYREPRPSRPAAGHRCHRGAHPGDLRARPCRGRALGNSHTQGKLAIRVT